MKLAGIIGGLGLILAGCGGYVYTTVGGTVTGLGTGNVNSLYLQNDAGYKVLMTADGPYSFNVASNASYKISVLQQPNMVNCTVANGSGTMSGSGSVTNVNVTCVPNVQVSGTVVGLPDNAGTLVLNNNVTDQASATNLNAQASVTANGAFQFANYVVSGYHYNVTVGAQPPGQYCMVQNGSGVANNANPAGAANVAISCVAGIAVKATVNGLNSGGILVLNNTTTDKVDQLTVSSIGIYNFGWSLLSGMRYSVSVATQPSGQTCTVQNGSGVVDLANPAAANVTVNCV